jgi:hypothetical protein
MESWIPVIELIAIFLLFMLSAKITVSRLTQPLPKVSKKTGVTKMDILRENDLTAVSIITTLFYMALLVHLAANFLTA